jgi:hypothetical protein
MHFPRFAAGHLTRRFGVDQRCNGRRKMLGWRPEVSMRPTLVLALLCGCLSAAPALADSVTKPNNDATLRAPHVRPPPVYRPPRLILVPIRQDLEPTK